MEDTWDVDRTMVFELGVWGLLHTLFVLDDEVTLSMWRITVFSPVVGGPMWRVRRCMCPETRIDIRIFDVFIV